MAFAAVGDREKVYELFSMIQPINHASQASDVAIYKVEPYVMAADVYANESHRGRGGWTWYTGSAGWMYQFITGSLLGLDLQGDKLIIKPCFPVEWPSVSIAYKYGKSIYNITVYQTSEKISHWKDGKTIGEGNVIQLVDTGSETTIEVHCRI
jgi:cellobiose phosphorylase